MRLLAAIPSLSGRSSNQFKVTNRYWSVRYCCYWIPLLSSFLGSTTAFQAPNQFGIARHTFRQYQHTSTCLFLESRQELEQLRVVDLKEKLKEQGLKVGGRKAELIDRLLNKPETTASMPRRSPRKALADVEANTDDTIKEPLEEKPKKRARKTKAKADENSETKKSPKKKQKAPEQRITDVDEIPKLWNDEKAKANGSYSKCDDYKVV